MNYRTLEKARYNLPLSLNRSFTDADNHRLSCQPPHYTPFLNTPLTPASHQQVKTSHVLTYIQFHPIPPAPSNFHLFGKSSVYIKYDVHPSGGCLEYLIGVVGCIGNSDAASISKVIWTTYIIRGCHKNQGRFIILDRMVGEGGKGLEGQVVNWGPNRSL